MSEPRHYWPFPVETTTNKPTVAELADNPPAHAPERTAPVGEATIHPYQVTSNAEASADFAFSPEFFELDGDGAPKVPLLSQNKIQEVAKASLGE